MMLSRRALLKTVSAAALASQAPRAIARPDATGDARIRSLIGAMTLEEKAGQLSLFHDPVRPAGIIVDPNVRTDALDALKARIRRGEITALFDGIGVAMSRELQRVAVEESRLKIPLIFAMDVVHGLHTIFPVPLGEASSFDPALAERTARAAAIESCARGLHWTFAPMVDVARDQRWGRVVEGAGEDSWLGALFGAARVRGFQGAALNDSTSLLACPKHFAAYGAVQGGMDYNSAEISDITLHEVHLPPFEAAFRAGALSAMASFNDISGVPSTANRQLLTGILRDKWKFQGFVVSDFTSDQELVAHGYAEDERDAVIKALSAGCDMSMQSGIYNRHIPSLVREGRLPMEIVDRAVWRVLSVKQALGLLDDPYRSLDFQREKADVRRPEAVKLAREAARRSMVLLRNEGGLLPLSKRASIALIGPSVRDQADLPGPWSPAPDVKSHVTFEQGLREAMAPGTHLAVVPGSGYEAPVEGGIAQAVAAAKAADVALLVIGESAKMSGEAQSRADIGIPAAQLALAEAVMATGKPVVLLLRHGRALALAESLRNAGAIMATWFLGSETGHAVADIVFGDFAPSGRLPVSFPLMTGQQPLYYNRRTTGRPERPNDAAYKARYRDAPSGPLYPFGHGLTYSTIDYGPTQVEAENMKQGSTLRVRAKVTNSGSRDAHEVAQLYIHDRAASITQPMRQLRGVRHLDLKPGQSRVVEFTLTSDDLAFVHADLRRAADPGTFDVWIAPSAEGGTGARFTLV